MSLPTNALERLQSVASEFGATLSDDNSGQASITITLPSGRQQNFELGLTFTDDAVSVSENPVGAKLPSFCPDRHINLGGSFCLGWGADDPSIIDDVDAARMWWSTLARYLAQQVVATKRSVWPGREHGRAHGDAAKDQAIAEDAAAKLGPAFAENAQAGRFKVRLDKRPGHTRLELWHADKRLARISIRTKELVGDNILCPCDAPTGAQIAECGDHAEDLATYMLALYRWRKADREFMGQIAVKGIKCCGTLSSCGLRDAALASGNTPKRSEKPNARRSKYYRPPTRSKRPR